MKTSEVGFTGLQLLAVLTILGVMTAILFPLFARPHCKCRQTNCLSNLKQLGLAFEQYTQDYDTQMPPRNTSTSQSIRGTGWAGTVFPYLKSFPLLHCPDDPNVSCTRARIVAIRVSYAMNSNVTEAKDTDFISPVHTVLAFEVAHVNAIVTHDGERHSKAATQQSSSGNGVNGCLASADHSVTGILEKAGYATGPLDNSTPLILPAINQFAGQPPRHHAGSNFLFKDGHAKWFTPANVSAGGNALHSGNLQSSTGCAPNGSKHSGSYPCAEGTTNGTHHATFSVN